MCIKNEYLGLCRSKKEAEAIFDTVFFTGYMALVVEGWRSGVINVYDYVKTNIAPFPSKKCKSKSIKKLKGKSKSKRKSNEQVLSDRVGTLGKLDFQHDEVKFFRVST